MLAAIKSSEKSDHKRGVRQARVLFLSMTDCSMFRGRRYFEIAVSAWVCSVLLFHSKVTVSQGCWASVGDDFVIQRAQAELVKIC